MKLELKHLAPYLPYNLKCQYLGIVDINKYNSTKIDPLDINQDRGYGLKIGYLKEIHVFKKYWTAKCGIYSRGLKSFVNGYELFPILRPLSDLTKEIEINGERFVPINKLHPIDKLQTKEIQDNFLEWLIKDHAIYARLNDSIRVYNRLLEWHFDVFGLIEQGLAVDINTLKK